MFSGENKIETTEMSNVPTTQKQGSCDDCSIQHDLFNPLVNGFVLRTLNISSDANSSETECHKIKMGKAQADYIKGLEFYRKKEMHEAKDLLESAVINAPNAEILLLCGKVNEALSNFAEAHHYYSAAMKYDPCQENEAVVSFSRTLQIIQEEDKKQLKGVCDKWAELRTARPTILRDLLADKDFHVATIQGSAYVEGNSISIQQAHEILYNDKTCNCTLTEHFEIVGLQNASNYVNELLKANYQIKTLDQIRKIHKHVMFYDSKKAGALRRVDVTIENHDPIRACHVDEAMQLFIKWLNGTDSETLNPIHFAAAAHYYFADIHPFEDGNGRTARLLMNWILVEANYPPVIIDSSNAENYLDSLRVCNEEGNPSAFIRFIVKQIPQTLKVCLTLSKKD